MPGARLDWEDVSGVPLDDAGCGRAVPSEVRAPLLEGAAATLLLILRARCREARACYNW